MRNQDFLSKELSSPNLWPPHWKLAVTGDGSPSLEWRGSNTESASDTATGEAMHHSAGALTESLYIYAPVIERVLDSSNITPVIVSIGLGLGYNELLVAQRALLKGHSRYHLISYESDPWLRECFQDWIQSDEAQVATVLSPLYNQIAARITSEPQSLKRELRRASQEGNFELRGALETAEQLPPRITAYLWDAFSRKTSPALWDEDFLVAALQKADPEGAWFSTYACMGNLKRALKRANFTVEIRPGFSGKRESIGAWSGGYQAFVPPGI